MGRVVPQTLSKVHDLEPGRLVKLSKMNQTLVRDQSILVAELQGVVGCMSFSNVVAVQKRNLGGLRQSLSTQHLDVCPGNGGDTCGTGATKLGSLDDRLTPGDLTTAIAEVYATEGVLGVPVEFGDPIADRPRPD